MPKEVQSSKLEGSRFQTFHPVGLPGYTQETNQFFYDWKRIKGKERHARDPTAKPRAMPIDDEYLNILPPNTSEIAWSHMQTNKKRPSLEDFNDIPEPTIMVNSDSGHSSVRDMGTETPRPPEPKIEPPTRKAREPKIEPPIRKAEEPKIEPPIRKARKPKPKAVEISRPPWQSISDPDVNIEERQPQPSKIHFPTSANPEFPTFELEQFCQQDVELPGTYPCAVTLCDIMECRNARKWNREAKTNVNSVVDDFKHSKCPHLSFKVLPGKVRRSLPWAPCAPIPKLLLICHSCGEAFREKPGIQAGKNLALVEFCSYATEDGDVIVFHLDPLLAGFESICDYSTRPRRVKCPCQRCRRRRRRVGDHFPDCECELCLKRLSKCRNKNYFTWCYQNYQKQMAIFDEYIAAEKVNNAPPSPWYAEAEDLEERMKACKCPECRKLRRPGDHFKDCDCKVCQNKKLKCLRYTLNKDNDTDGDEVEAHGTLPKPPKPQTLVKRKDNDGDESQTNDALPKPSELQTTLEPEPKKITKVELTKEHTRPRKPPLPKFEPKKSEKPRKPAADLFELTPSEMKLYEAEQAVLKNGEGSMSADVAIDRRITIESTTTEQKSRQASETPTTPEDFEAMVEQRRNTNISRVSL